MASRRADIDWLRIAATYLLFVFHVGKVFDPAPFFHIRNAEQSFVMLVICGFIGLWHMPLFFLLAGWSAAASLEARGTGTFLRERLHRLGVPLVAGCVLLAPVIKYLELRSGLDLNHTGLRVASEHQDTIRLLIPGGLPVAEPFDRSFATFLPTFFTQLDRFTWSHLWFVAYLLTLTVVYVPLFGWLLGRRGTLRSSGAWALYVPLVPLVLIQLTMREHWPGIYNLYNDWANVAYYSVFLLSGFFLACHPSVEDAVAREWGRSLTIGGLATGVLLLGVLRVFSSPAVLLVGTAIAGWCFVIALLGIARRYFTATGPTLSYLSESAFPVYVLHQAAIVLPGYWVVGLPLGIATKYVLLLLLAVAITMSTYHWVVRPFAVPRFLLGMRAKACPLPRPAALSRSAAAVLVLAVVGYAHPTHASASAATPIGVWYAEGGAAKVGIERCDEAKLCGRVLWLRSPLDEDGCPLRDVHNPDPALRARQVEGLEVLRGLMQRADGTWTDGSIYDPASGYTYRCQLSLDGNDRLRLRGYVGVPLIGRTTTWTRVGAESRMCADARR
jgi:uncharacterized protein (DUF2147 family)/fucose 4-O-acetylase-like acetyltransferase